MADEVVASVLQQWGFENLIPTFRAQDIDEESFNSLTETDLQELIPTVGLRRKFLNKFQSYQIVIKATEVSFLNTDESTDTNSVSVSSLSVDAEDNSTESLDDLIPVSYGAKATIGLPYTPTRNNGEKSTVRELIESTDEGKIIAASYSAGNGFLRSKLSELIIKNELREDKNQRITSARFRQLAQEINSVFLHENPEIYYVAYAKNYNGKPKAARGKLWSSYIYLRKKYKSLGIIPNIIAACTSDVEYPQEENEKVQWLKNNIDPVDIVQDYWKSTTNIRIHNFPSTIREYVHSYPILKQPLGYMVLEFDFNNKYPGKENIFFCKWSQLSLLLIDIAENKKDSYLKSILKEYKLLEERPTNCDEVFALTILPLFFSCVNIKTKKPGFHWKPSKVELKNSFLLHVTSIEELETKLEERNLRYSTLGLTSQPLPVIVGDIRNIQVCYVCVNELRYKVETPLKAVDLCFKIVHALSTDYPRETDTVWIFVQNYIYEIYTNKDRKYVSVTSLMSDLQKLNGKSSE